MGDGIVQGLRDVGPKELCPTAMAADCTPLLQSMRRPTPVSYGNQQQAGSQWKVIVSPSRRQDVYSISKRTKITGSTLTTELVANHEHTRRANVWEPSLYTQPGARCFLSRRSDPKRLKRPVVNDEGQEDLGYISRHDMTWLGMI